MAGCSGRPFSGPGITSGPPETHSRIIVSPEAMLATGAKEASNPPQRQVATEAGIRVACDITLSS